LCGGGKDIFDTRLRGHEFSIDDGSTSLTTSLRLIREIATPSTLLRAKGFIRSQRHIK